MTSVTQKSRYYVYAGNGSYINWQPANLQPGFIPYIGGPAVGYLTCTVGLPENTFGRETAMTLCALARRDGHDSWLVQANNLAAPA